MTLSNDEIWRARMIEAIQRTKEYANRGRNQFFQDEDTQQLVVHNLEHVVESADHLSQHFKKDCMAIDWSGLSRIRTLIIHQYAEVNSKRVWEFVRDELPLIERALVRARPARGKV